MEAVRASADCADRAAAANSLAARPDLGVRRYQPLLVLTLAIAAGIVCDRYAPRAFPASADGPARGWIWFVLAWSSCACCLALWLLAWSRRLNRTAPWILLFAAALAGASWHEVNLF